MSDDIKYEEAIKQLEEIVLKLENGSASLDESISLFEKGTKLASVCSNKSAQQKITLLTKENNNDWNGI